MTFRDWLESDECFAILRQCAKQVSNRAARLGIVLEDSCLEEQNRDDYYTAVAGDLWQFLKGNAAKIAEQASILLISGDDYAFMTFLCGKFLDDRIDERRTSSPFHRYYREMRAELSKAEGLTYMPKSRAGSFYAWSRTEGLEVLPDQPYDRDYRGWKACDIPFSNIWDKQAMLGLSRHFWDESLREFLREYLLPIRELVRFVCAKYPLLLTVEYVDAQGEEHENGDPVMSLECRLVDSTAATAANDDAWRRQMPVIEADVIDTQLEVLARDCSSEMTADERCILWRIDDGVKLEDVAAELGMKSPANVSYHQNKAYSKIRTKWSLWGPPSPKGFDDVDEEEFFIFYEKVIGFCKSIGFMP